MPLSFLPMATYAVFVAQGLKASGYLSSSRRPTRAAALLASVGGSSRRLMESDMRSEQKVQQHFGMGASGSHC